MTPQQTMYLENLVALLKASRKVKNLIQANQRLIRNSDHVIITEEMSKKIDQITNQFEVEDLA